MSRQVINVLAMTSGHRSLGHLVVPTNANLSAVLLCQTVNISARYNHCTIALPISAIIITDILASYRRLGDDRLPLICRASCSTDRCESQNSYFVTQIISQHDTSIARLHCQSALSLLQMSWRVIDVSAMTSSHWSVGHLVAPTDANLSAVLLCHTGNISARYKHCMIALPISAIIITDVLASYRRLGDDQWPSVFRASCSADRCESLGSLTLSHS